MNLHRVFLLFLTFILISLLPLIGQATVNKNRFEEANAAYSRNDFTTAISVYEDLVAEHGYSSQLLYNLGNSYAQSGKIGKAILNYERAIKLAPHDSDAIGNLQLIRNTNGLFTEKASLLQRFLHQLSMNQWITMACLALIMLTTGLLLSLWFPVTKRTQLILTIGCLATIAMGVINTMALQQEWKGYVVIEESRLLISPFEGAAAAGNIQEGRVVFPGEKHGDFIFVEDETGRKGWVLRAAVEPVIPPQE